MLFVNRAGLILSVLLLAVDGTGRAESVYDRTPANAADWRLFKPPVNEHLALPISQGPPPPVIMLHRDGNRLTFEIPRRTLETDLLITCHIDTAGVPPIDPARQPLPWHRR